MCTFDKGMCGRRDLPSDQFEHFDWKRLKGPSSTKGTGPPFDHTNGTLEGLKIKKDVVITQYYH
ncbi:hypothetical protein DPMN_038329 [Dreissena polymorpha]|uniref:MAM domain-containing protein n=1 Tax=Dreissena polymorpha TaxID=45954 RepID=A0A9D4MGR5_DREPO|nr:hypothetical protein DPMN_038329 [Dreissena polymorpha]